MPSSNSSSRSTAVEGDGDGTFSSCHDAERPLLRPTTSCEAPIVAVAHRTSCRCRLLDRDAAFHQSRGRWRVQHASSSSSPSQFAQQQPPQGVSALVQGGVKQFWGNWFYALAYQRTLVLMLILFSSYTLAVFFYAAIYLFVSQIGQEPQDPSSGSSSPSTQCFCDMDIHDHMEALYFSLSTMTTIGYGVSDYYFGGCWTPLLLVLSQTCTAITFNAVAVGLIFQRLSRGHKRGKTVLFSNTAVVKRVRGRFYLQFRIAELRSHQLLEASVRAYCVRQERHLVPQTTCLPNGHGQGNDTPVLQTTHFVSKPMKLQHEDVSSHILMSLPQVIVHCIDEKSPLLPPSVWFDSEGQRRQYRHHVDTTTSGTPDVLVVPSCNGNNSMLQQKNMLESFARDRQTEIIVLVEGSDELTGAVIQTRHSYTYSDLVWDQSFLPCVFPCGNGGNEGQLSDPLPPTSTSRRWNLFGRRDVVNDQRNCAKACVIDFSNFHETTEAPEDADGCPYVLE